MLNVRVERDQALMAKKEEKIKKLLEEEKAAREFHANPIPKGAGRKLDLVHVCSI
jgi:hypothetical protein